jgi:hypothetical protein
MSFIRARRTSCSGSSPLKTSMPDAISPKLAKPSRPRSNTVSSTTCPDTLPPARGTDGDNAEPKQESNKDYRSAWTRLKLGYDKPLRSRDDVRSGQARPLGPADGPEPQRRNAIYISSDSMDMKIEKERRRLAEAKAKIEEEVREHTEFLRLLRSRREKVAEQGEKLRRSISPEKRPATPKSRFTTPDPETPPPSRLPSPSPARRACHEAYARMSPLEQHLLRDQMHCDGIRSRDTRREQEERREWQEYQKHSHQPPYSPGTSPTKQTRWEEERGTRSQDLLQRRDEIQADAIRLENLWRERERREIANAWEMYESRWALFSSSPPEIVRLHDLPWPVTSVFAIPHRMAGKTFSLTHMLSQDAVSTFLLSAHHSGDKARKQRLHEALLRYHPDRCEGRWLERIPEVGGERETVREAAGVVARIMGRLLQEEQ